MTVSTTRMTAQQYFQLGEDPPGVRLELVNGEIAVSPSPTPEHSKIVLALAAILMAYVEDNDLGEVLADVDTVFGQHDVRRPDLLFFSRGRRSLVTARRLAGRPDLAVEVVSAASEAIDKSDKFKQYARGGVRFYWIVDPCDRTFRAFTLKGGKYALTLHAGGDELVCAPPFPALRISLKKLWWRKS